MLNRNKYLYKIQENISHFNDIIVIISINTIKDYLDIFKC